MNVYFVRHGTTDAFDQQICQSPNEQLSTLGISQANNLANHLSLIDFDLVLSSNLQRAIDTARAITQDFTTSSLFNETTHPSEIIGKPRNLEPAKSIINKINEMSLTDPSWHHSDEENFVDLKKRGVKAIDFLTSNKKENILVVSHGNFIKLLLGTILYGAKFTITDYVRLLKVFKLDNTGVSLFSYDHESSRWYVKTWNETSHLG